MRLLATLIAAALAGSPLAAEIPIRGRVVGDVASGDHVLWAWSRGFAVGELPVTVADAPVFGLEVELGRGGVIFGHILGLEPELLSRVRVTTLGRAPASITAKWTSRAAIGSTCAAPTWSTAGSSS